MSKILQTAISTGSSKLLTAWKYAKVEMRPPSPGEFGEVRRGFGNLMSAIGQRRWRQTTVRDAWLNTMVGLEIAFWFYVGEVIGRRSLYGYVVPGH